MGKRDFDVLSRLFEQALALAPGARARFLDEACRDDNDLRQELAALVSSHQEASGYFEGLANDIVIPALVAIADEAGDEIAPGQTVSHYRIIEKLGAGGMGVVFKAQDLQLGRFVALKFLPHYLSADAAAKARFLVEAQSASALDHPNIAIVHGIGETETGRLFIVMAHYEGETLDRKNKGGGLPMPEVLDVARQIGSALAAAHGKRIIHRDVKPSNILITKDGTAKLLDFGIAKLAHSKETGKAAALGTLAYMSPEQVRGDDVDHRTDLWSLGVVLYEISTGKRPFRGDDDEALVHSIRYDEYSPIDRVKPILPGTAARIVERCLAKDPDCRYSDVQELLTDLRALGTNSSPQSRAASNRHPDANLLYLKGRHFLDKGDPASVGRARDYFQQAVDLDPAFAHAWSGLADAYHMLGVVSPLPAADVYPRTKAAAERALAIDADLPEAHVSLGTALSYYYWDFEAAAQHFRRAIELNPSNADAHRLYAEYLRYQGRFDEALVEAKLAQALDPLSPGPHIEQGITLYVARRYDEAITQFRRLLNVNPNFAYTHFFLALVHVQKQEYERALEALDKVGGGQRPHDVETLRAYIHAVTGRTAEARRGLEKLEALSPNSPVSSWHLAMVQLALGDRDRALDLLEQAWRDRAWEFRLLPLEPLFDPLRSDPRLAALVEKVRH